MLMLLKEIVTVYRTALFKSLDHMHWGLQIMSMWLYDADQVQD